MPERVLHVLEGVARTASLGEKQLGDLLVTDQRLIFIQNATHWRNSNQMLENSWALGLLGLFVESISREIRDSRELHEKKRRAQEMKSLRYGRSIDSLAAGSEFSTIKGEAINIRAGDSGQALIVSDGSGTEGRFASYGSERSACEIARDLSSAVPTYDSEVDADGFYLTTPSPETVITRAEFGNLEVSESEGNAIAANPRYIEALLSRIAQCEPEVRIRVGRGLTACPKCLRNALGDRIKDPVFGFRLAVSGMPWPVGAISLAAAIAVLVWAATIALIDISHGAADRIGDDLGLSPLLLIIFSFAPMIQGFRVLHNRNKFKSVTKSYQQVRSALSEQP